MKKVYCILCHKYTMALEYSVGYLSSFDNNLILIHVDLNSDIEVFQSLNPKMLLL